MKKIVTFGEILFRLSKSGYRRLSQTSLFNGNFGGSEANVAVSLSTLGDNVEYVTRVPDNQMGRAAILALQQYGIGLNHVCLGGDRIGEYYFEEAAAMRNSCVVYDRNNSSFYSMEPGMIDWHNVLKDADAFHCSGITCSLSQSAADATFEAVETAKEMGLTVVCDINYRKNLWKYGADAHETLHRLCSYSDIIFGDQGEWEVVTGRKRVPFEALDSNYAVDYPAFENYLKMIHSEFPNCKHIVMAMRNQITSSHHTLTGLLYTGEKMYKTKIYDIQDIVDPMGVGDAFVAGFIHARLHYADDNQKCLDYSLAASTLKNSVSGDFNLSTDDEIQNLMLQ